MLKHRIMSIFLCLVLFAGITAGVALPQKASAATESISLTSPYPSLQADSGTTFTFTVILKYTGDAPKVFDLSTQVPTGGIAAIKSSDNRRIASITLNPAIQDGQDAVSIDFLPNMKDMADPGSYKFTFTAKSGGLSSSIELTAVVDAYYSMLVTTQTGRLNAEITAGQDNIMTYIVANDSSVAIDDVAISCNLPDGWQSAINPEIMTSIPAGTTKAVNINVKPPKNTIAGDYAITIRADSQKVQAQQEIRITVKTPSVWGWIGILIVVLVIAGLAFIFRQLGRR